MKIVLLSIGKTSEEYLIEGIAQYQKRLKHYTQFALIEVPNIKKAQNFSKNELMKKEGELILNKIQASDYLVLLDDKGAKTLYSTGYLQKKGFKVLAETENQLLLSQLL